MDRITAKEQAIAHMTTRPPGADNADYETMLTWLETIIRMSARYEREACNQIAAEVDRQSSALLQNTETEVNRSYYTGRCNGATLIAQLIIALGDS